ncbi:MAG: hypothetical protein JXX14_00130 [Deltaproteobacteria bacterium]|nr:hypothetical protein [Deltaproteobacteria bacterium]
MQILLLSTRYIPETRPAATPFIQKLAGQFVKLGHDVRLIVPGSFDFERMQTPLAQRLTPITVGAGDTATAYTRFDARTTAGVQLHVLKSRSEMPSAYSREVFGDAVGQLILGSEFSPGTIIVFNDNVALSDNLKTCPVRIAAYTAAPNLSAQALAPSALTDFNRVIIHGQILAASLLEDSANTPIARQIANGTAEILPLCADAIQSTPAHKQSAKASLQNSLGLPVRNDVPVFFLDLPLTQSIDALPELLKHDLQLVCKCSEDAVTEFLETYPDRLCVVPPDVKNSAIVGAVDFCMQQNHQDNVTATILAGTVPIVPAKNNSTVLALSPDGQSGTGIVYAGNSLNVAAGKAMGLFSHPATMTSLRKRLSHTIASIETVAAQYLPESGDLARQQSA